MGAGLRTAQLAAVFGSVFVLTLAQLGIPSGEFWGGKHALLICVTVVSGAVAVAELARTVLTETQAARIQRYERDVRATLSAALALSCAELGCPWQSVGVHAFLARRPNGPRRLVNIGGIRMGSDPSMTFPKWTGSKGVIGSAFTNQTLIAADWGGFAAQSILEGRGAWEALRRNDRWSMSWGELNLSERYEGIVAYPVFGRTGKPLGVVSVDAPVAKSMLAAPNMELIMRDAATAISSLGPPPSGWWSFHA